MLGPKETLLYSFLVACVLSGQAQSVFNIPECANRRLFIISRDGQFFMTCTGLFDTSNIYWSISSPLTNGTEIRLGECDRCYRNCANTNCSNFNSGDYSITRHRSDVTTLTFVHNLEQNHGALIKCSQQNNDTGAQAFCATQNKGGKRRPQFKLTECNNGVLEILPTQTVSLTCTGLWPLSNIYWSLSGPSTNHTEVRLGQCPSCYPNCDSTPCDVHDNNRYPISRPRYDVTVFENVHMDDDDTITCSQQNNASTAQSTCTIRTVYQLLQCEDGQLDVSAEDPWTAIRCEGLRSYHNITWTLTDSSNQTTDVASCTACSDCDKACDTTTDDVIASRSSRHSELRIVGNVRQKATTTVACVRQDGATGDSCRLRVIYGPSSLTLSGLRDVVGGFDTLTLTCAYDEAFPAVNITWSVQCDNPTHLPEARTETCSFRLGQSNTSIMEVSCTVFNSIFPQINRTAWYHLPLSTEGAGSSDFPLIPAAGGGGAALLVIIIVIVVVFVARRKKRKKRQPNNEEHVNASYDGNNEMEVTLVNGAAPTNNGVTMTTDALHTAACADNYTYIEIDDNEDRENSTTDAQQAKRVVIPSAHPANRQPKGENRDVDDFEEYINELYDSTDNAVLIDGKTPSSPNPTSPTNTNVSKPGRQIPSQPSTTAFSATNGLFKIDDDVSYDNKAVSSVIGPKGDAYTQVYKVKKAQPLHAEHEKAGNSIGEAAQTQTTEERAGRTREQSRPAMVSAMTNESEQLKGNNSAENLDADDETEYVNTLSCSTTECPDDTVYVNVGDTSVPSTDMNAMNAPDGPNDVHGSTDNKEGITKSDDEYNRLGFTRPRPQDDPHYSHLSQL